LPKATLVISGKIFRETWSLIKLYQNYTLSPKQKTISICKARETQNDLNELFNLPISEEALAQLLQPAQLLEDIPPK
jgi:hypothetical protein